MPASSVETTGRAEAMASMITVGKMSLAPLSAVVAASAKMSQRWSFSSTQSCGKAPASVTREPSRNSSIWLLQALPQWAVADDLAPERDAALTQLLARFNQIFEALECD